MDIKSALIVDDSQMARIFLKKQLEGMSVSVEMVGSGEESIDFLAKNQPDVIFMDCLMPGLDGFATTKKILANPDYADIPIIMCTGKESEEDKDKAFNIGAVGYMCKSSSSEPLQAILEKLNQTKAPITLSETTSSEAELLKNKQTNIEDIASEIATKVATKVANDVSMLQKSSFEDKFKNEINSKITSLSKQFEKEVIISVKSSLEYNQSYVDDKIAHIDKSIIPALKVDVNDSIAQAIKELKTELDQVDINAIIDQHIDQQTQSILENNLSTITSILSEHEMTHKVIKSKIEEQQAEYDEQIQSLEAKIALKSDSNSNVLSIIAFLLGAGALAVALYPILKTYF